MARKLMFSVTIKDCEVQSMCAGGSGGQHQNRVETAIRITHRPSGAVGVARDSKSQHANKKAAFKRMAETKEFQKWVRIEAAKIMGEKSIDEKVEEAMNINNLKFEIKDDGKWTGTTYEKIEE
jgi:protein subunit release factor B